MVTAILAVLDAHPHMTLAVLAVVTVLGAVVALSGLVAPARVAAAPYRPDRFAATMSIQPGTLRTALPTAYVVAPALWPLGAFEVQEIAGGRVTARVAFNDYADACECALQLNAWDTLAVLRPPKPKALVRAGLRVGMVALV